MKQFFTWSITAPRFNTQNTSKPAAKVGYRHILRESSVNLIRTLVLLSILILSVSMLSADCRMMALMGLNDNNLSSSAKYDSTFYGFTFPTITKLKDLSHSNPHGWSLAWYDYDDQGPILNPNHIVRSDDPAYNDWLYDHTVNIIRDTKKPKILMGHVRYASSGSSTIPDPHPFIMEYQNRDFSFMHNGL